MSLSRVILYCSVAELGGEREGWGWGGGHCLKKKISKITLGELKVTQLHFEIFCDMQSSSDISVQCTFIRTPKRSQGQ